MLGWVISRKFLLEAHPTACLVVELAKYQEDGQRQVLEIRSYWCVKEADFYPIVWPRLKPLGQHLRWDFCLLDLANPRICVSMLNTGFGHC